MTDPTTREVPGVGTQYLYRLPAEAGGGVAWLSDATHGASVVWHTCPDGVARRAYRCHAPPSQPARRRKLARLRRRDPATLADLVAALAGGRRSCAPRGLRRSSSEHPMSDPIPKKSRTPHSQNDRVPPHSES